MRRARPRCAGPAALVVAFALVALAVAPAPLVRRATAAAGLPDDPSDELFDPARIHDVRLELTPDAVDTLRASCTPAEQAADPSVRCDERVSTRLTVDGYTLDRVGVRLKGGSGSWRSIDEKASFSIKTDEFVEDQSINGERKFTLGNAIYPFPFALEPNFVAETLTYDVFRAAGIPAPRTALANVYVNDEHFGLYVMREAYDKRFLDRNFDDPDGNLYETVGGADLASTDMEARTNERTNDKADLEALAKVVETTPDAKYRKAIGELVDLRQLTTYWAVEALTGHADGYLYNTGAPPWPNNFYAYHDPDTDKFVVLPWGADGTFGVGGGTELTPDTPALVPPKAQSTLATRLWALPGTSDALRRRMLKVLDQAWDEDALVGRADALAALVRADGLTGSREGATIEQFEEAFARRRAFILARPAAVRAQLSSTEG